MIQPFLKMNHMQDHLGTEPESEVISHIPRSQKLPIPPPAMTDDQLHNEDSENESFETNNADQTSQDHLWSPSVHNKGSLRNSLSELETRETILTPESRYNLRPRGIRTEVQIDERPQPDCVTSEETTEDEQTLDLTTCEPLQNTNENLSETRQQPPYNLRLLPGRHLAQ
jgi:hypothetical protein